MSCWVVESGGQEVDSLVVQQTEQALRTRLWMVSKCQLSVLLPEGKCVIKRQLYSERFTLREAASFIFQYQW